MDDLIRARIHEALEVELPDAGLRSRVIGAVPADERPARRLGPAGSPVTGYAPRVLTCAELGG